ncbi:MAG: M23 family metallopeptidase [Rhizobiaceae bacterium]|nr:M23 family metallopeptidase [Rhizobiaceae bacterium]
MVIRPWMFAVAASFLGVFAIGYLLATTYLVMRDDLIGASMAQQARLQHSYEDRIANLRTELDRVTSRQLLNQQLVQDKVAELMQRQAQLSSRHGALSPILNRAGITDTAPAAIPVPVPRPKDQANMIEADGSTAYQTAFVGGTLFQDKAPRLDTPATLAQKDILLLDDTSRLFGSVALSLEHIEEQQINRIQSLAQNTSRKTAEITRILKGSQLPAPRIDESAIGGPFIAADDNQAFDYSLRGLDQALQQFDKVLNHIDVLPIKNPVVGAKISSHYGHRRDPFLKRRAFHAGMDFKAKTGTRVYAAAKGKVTKAGWSGGYGRMVEIDHSNGTTTRYAHLSRISVKKGQYVSPDMSIGRVGSSGRSTGPHLHYEIRRYGKAVNPSRYINAGQKLSPLLKSS